MTFASCTKLHKGGTFCLHSCAYSLSYVSSLLIFRVRFAERWSILATVAIHDVIDDRIYQWIIQILLLRHLTYFRRRRRRFRRFRRFLR
ncbi:hypothetical protein C8J55DRAFT_523283 [Lentinula edodes]|uniref:Uncharacterized protein n=1 Tax=Lentinula lateritia TaxID=40482 RepID=A0A9W8ZY71_9AGAR|nr:hypothetical protein C8J55DRAFT_523283 [Lentinula edodes]